MHLGHLFRQDRYPHHQYDVCQQGVCTCALLDTLEHRLKYVISLFIIMYMYNVVHKCT